MRTPKSALKYAGVCLLAFAACIAHASSAELRWGDCGAALGAGVRCGWLMMPAPNEQAAVKLRVALLQAPAPSVPPVVYIPGGPGGAAGLTPEGLRRWRAWQQQAGWPADIILFDPRGTGQSRPPADCPEVIGAREQAATQALSAKADFARERAALRDCYSRLRAGRLQADRLQADRQQSGSSDAARVERLSAAAQVDDIAALLDALALEQVNLWGVSYGTRLALLVAAQYPHRVRSIVLDSMLPFFVNDLAAYPEQISTAIERLDGACATNPACAATGLPSGHIARLLERYQRAPPRIAFDYKGTPRTLVVTPYRLLLLFLYSSYTADSQIETARRIARAAAGQPSALAPLAQRLWQFMQLPAMSEAVFWSTRCSVTQRPLTQARWRRVLANHPMIAPYLAPAWDYRICSFWSLASKAEAPDTGEFDMPMLVLAGLQDAVTPVAWARRFVAETPSARLATFAGQSHVPSLTGPCAIRSVAVFLRTPERYQLPGCVSEVVD